MKQETKAAIASALRNIATNIEQDNDIPNPWDLFDTGPKSSSDGIQKDERQELNDYFHETIGKSKRSLNHSLNKVNLDWKMKSLRTPMGPRALEEVAKDCNLDVREMCSKILLNPRFKDGAIGDAARQLI